MGKKLTVYMIDGNEYGPRIAEIGNWVGKCLYSTRASITKILGRVEFSNPGVYFLKSSPSSNSFSERIYIGESENVRGRLKDHLSNPDRDFDELVFFISKDELLTKTQIKYLESRLVQLAIDAKSAEIENANNPGLPTLHEADISDMEYFLEQIKLILPIMGFRFLIPTVAKHIPAKSAPEEIKESMVFKIRSGSFPAFMYETSQGFIVKKGSQANKNLTASITETYRKLRQKLIESSILVDKGSYFEFAEDTIFNSPSAASNIVLGRQSAGPIEWVNINNVTYKDLETVEYN